MLRIFKRRTFERHFGERPCKMLINRVAETCYGWATSVSGVDDAQYLPAGGSFNKNNNSAKLAGTPSRTELFYRDANSPTFARTCPAYWRKRSSVCSFPQWRRESRGRGWYNSTKFITRPSAPDGPPFSQSSTARFLLRLTAATQQRKARSHVLR